MVHTSPCILDNYSTFLTRGGKEGNSIACHVEGRPDLHADTYQLNRLRMAKRPTGLIFTNGQCTLIYMNGCELSAFECCIHHAIGEESMVAPSTYGAVQGYNRSAWRPLRDIFVVPEPQGQGKVAILVAM